MTLSVRENLALFRWEPDRRGQDRWVLHDSVQNKYFFLDYVSKSLLESLKQMSSNELGNLVDADTTNASEAVKKQAEFAQFLNRNHLLSGDDTQADQAPLDSAHPLIQLIKTYISFRLPLIRPDQFLARTLPWVAWIFTKAFLVISVAAGLVGLVLGSRDPQAVLDQAGSLFSLASAPQLLVALIIAKLVHEFSHAYTAKKYQCAVPVMGIVFIVLFPLPYTDTSDTWRIYKNKQRMTVAAAGMLGEFCLACWATLLWNFVPSNATADVLFSVAVMTWITSLFINVMPFMRFDGYFLLMDYLQFPNLHPRSGQLGKWWIRKTLLGADLPAPEKLGRRTSRNLIIFAYITWLYRFFVFLTIALLVYHFFVKAVGIAMFIVEIWYFILAPIFREMGVWMKLRSVFQLRRSNIALALTAIGLIVLGTLPIRQSMYVSGYLYTTERQDLYSPYGGQIKETLVDTGQAVIQGQSIAVIENPQVALDRTLAEQRLNSALLRFTNSRLPNQNSRQARQETSIGAKRQALVEATRQSGLLTIKTPSAGETIELAAHVRAGETISENEPLATVFNRVEPYILADIPNDLIDTLAIQQSIRYFRPSTPLATSTAQVATLSSVASRTVSEPALIAIRPSEIQWRPDGNAEYLQPMNRLRLTSISEKSAPRAGAVTLRLRTKAESFFSRVAKKASMIILRETDF